MRLINESSNINNFHDIRIFCGIYNSVATKKVDAAKKNYIIRI